MSRGKSTTAKVGPGECDGYLKDQLVNRCQARPIRPTLRSSCLGHRLRSIHWDASLRGKDSNWEGPWGWSRAWCGGLTICNLSETAGVGSRSTQGTRTKHHELHGECLGWWLCTFSWNPSYLLVTYPVLRGLNWRRRVSGGHQPTKWGGGGG